MGFFYCVPKVFNQALFSSSIFYCSLFKHYEWKKSSLATNDPCKTIWDGALLKSRFLGAFILSIHLGEINTSPCKLIKTYVCSFDLLSQSIQKFYQCPRRIVISPRYFEQEQDAPRSSLSTCCAYLLSHWYKSIPFSSWKCRMVISSLRG